MASDEISLKVHCGVCGAKVQIPEDAADEYVFECTCGNSDTVENILDIAGDAAAEYLAGGINDALRDVAEDNPFITFTASAPTPGSRKFIVRPA